MVDYSRAVKLSYQFRSLIGKDPLEPISEDSFDQFVIVLKHLKIKVFNYSDLKHLGTVDELIDIFGNDGAAIFDSPKNRFIALNDICDTRSSSYKERRFWTLLHEFGHFMLGHHTSQSVRSIRRLEYSEQESETDVFVANFFMPEAAVYNYMGINHPEWGSDPSFFLDSCDLGKMKSVFGVSWSALKFRLEFLGIQTAELSTYLMKTYRERKAVADFSDESFFDITLKRLQDKGLLLA